MKQKHTILNSMNNMDFTCNTEPVQSPIPTEEISTHVDYDFNSYESFDEIDMSEGNLTACYGQEFNEILRDLQTAEQYSSFNSDIVNLNELLRTDPDTFNSTESNDTANSIQSTDEQLAMIKPNDSSLPITRPHIEKLSIKSISDSSILLSKSVAVTCQTPNQLQIVHALEDTYRARYKSDYFPQNGTVRRPRYVADKNGNHYVTLQMPAEYKSDFKNEYIRIALITTAINDHGHYYSPYKFQTNHSDAKVPDQNPIFVPVNIQGNNLTMKFQLVLIKSKLDQLNDAQPLIPFSDTNLNIQNIINEKKLSPKELINTYQLDKSHIAFTLCTKLPNGSYDIHSETTIISSVITETTKQPPTSKTKSVKPVTTNSTKQICCPHCKHYFDLNDCDNTEKVNKRKSNSSASNTSSKSTINNRSNKKKKIY